MRFTFDTTKAKKQIEENPLVAMGIGAAVLSGLARLMNANTNRKNSKTWAKEVKRREKKSTK